MILLYPFYSGGYFDNLDTVATRSYNVIYSEHPGYCKYTAPDKGYRAGYPI